MQTENQEIIKAPVKKPAVLPMQVEVSEDNENNDNLDSHENSHSTKTVEAAPAPGEETAP